MISPMQDAPKHPTYGEALAFWWKLGWISFGGPTGQIAIMQNELVERKKWIDEERFLHGLNFCMLLPGPEAQQLATYLGWRLHGLRGALTAGILFVLPAVFILLGFSMLYVLYGKVPWVEATFHGLVPAIIAIVINALLRLGAKTLTDNLRWALAFGSVLLIAINPDSFPIIVLSAGIIGFIWGKGKTPKTQPLPIHPPISFKPLLQTITSCLIVWFAPLLGLAFVLGWNHTVVREGLFFSKAALVTFGGAYAVLPYVAQQAVSNYHWLDHDQMLQGFGLAESTPGPLIMVLQFVGFLGAWNQPGSLSPMLSGILGALITSWVTFAPSFLFILVGAPFLDQLEKIPALKSALGGISSAVVGVMASFSANYAWSSILGGGEFNAGQVDYFVLIVSILAFFILRKFKLDVMFLILGCALLSLLLHFIAP